MYIFTNFAFPMLYYCLPSHGQHSLSWLGCCRSAPQHYGYNYYCVLLLYLLWCLRTLQAIIITRWALSVESIPPGAPSAVANALNSKSEWSMAEALRARPYACLRGSLLLPSYRYCKFSPTCLKSCYGQVLCRGWASPLLGTNFESIFGCFNHSSASIAVQN